MRRLLVDENFPVPVIDALLADGFDVLAIARTTPGISDIAVLRQAYDTDRCLLTFDSDFGDLVFFHGEPAPPAILYFRMHPILVADVLAAARQALTEVPDGHMAVVGRETLRLRRFHEVA